LQHVDRLGEVGHEDFVGVRVEDVERDGGDQRVAERVLLPEVFRVSSRRRRVPGAPFVNDEFDAALGVEVVENLTLLKDQRFHRGAVQEQFVPLVGGVVRRGPGRAAVVMRRAAVNAGEALQLGEEAARPIRIVAAGPAGDQEQRRAGNSCRNVA